MPRTLDPFRVLLVAVAGWMNQEQLQIIEYLREENRVLRAQIDDRRLRFDDDQRRRLAVRAKMLRTASVGRSGHHRNAGDLIAVAPQADL